MKLINHEYSEIERYLKTDNVFVQDVRMTYLPMIVMGVKISKRDGQIKLKVNGARYSWIRLSRYHQIYIEDAIQTDNNIVRGMSEEQIRYSRFNNTLNSSNVFTNPQTVQRFGTLFRPLTVDWNVDNNNSDTF